MASHDPELVEAFVAVLILVLIGCTLLIMGLLWLWGKIAEWVGGAAGESPQRLLQPQSASMGGMGYTTPAGVVAGAVVAGDQETVPLATSQWLALLNERPDDIPHLVLVGGTGTGKTTLATALLATRPGQVLVITPKPDDHWGGLPFVTIDDDGSFTTAALTFSGLLAEVRRRLVASKRKESPGPWLTVALDDYPALRSECPDANEAFLLIAQLGRSLRVRLIVLSYSGLVKELGLEGRGESRNHFVWVRLDRQRRAVLEWDGQALTLDTREVPRLAERPIPHSRGWAIPTVATTALESGIVPTTTTPAGGESQPTEAKVVVVGGVSVEEQVSIIRTALELQQEGGKFSRSEVCRRVFNGATAGAAYNKVKVVLDASGLGQQMP